MNNIKHKERSYSNHDLWFNLYDLKTSWVLTHPKIASSFMDFYGRTETQSQAQLSVYFTTGFKGINSSVGSDATQKKSCINFCSDWESLLQGKEIDKKIIFLTRNPIQKFITGLVQDFVLPELDEHIISTTWYRDLMIEEKHDPHLIDRFIRNVKDGTLQRAVNSSGQFPDCHELPIKYKDIYESSIKHTLDGIPNERGFQNIVDTISDGHMGQLQFELYNFIIDPPRGFNTESIKVVDINKEDLQLTLESIGEITPTEILNERRNNKYPHLRSPIIQETIRNILSKHGDIINQLLLPNLYGWINLLKITYPIDTSHLKATVDNPIHTLEKFQSKQYLNIPFKEYSDIFKPELYLSWTERRYCKSNLYVKDSPSIK